MLVSRHIACAIAIGSHKEYSYKYCDSYHGIFPHSPLKQRVKWQPYQERDLQADLYIYVEDHRSVFPEAAQPPSMSLKKKMMGLQWKPADILVGLASALWNGKNQFDQILNMLSTLRVVLEEEATKGSGRRRA